MDERARQDFTEFVAARSPELIRVACLLTGDQHAAEDLLQSALTREQLPAGGGSILRRRATCGRSCIASKSACGAWRARRPETTMDQVPEPPAANPASVETRLALQDALRSLPAGKRAVLVLRYLEDLPANWSACPTHATNSRSSSADT